MKKRKNYQSCLNLVIAALLCRVSVMVLFKV